MRKPKKEYYLEWEAEKIFINLKNGAKLRVLYYPAITKSEDTLNIVYNSGFNSYVFIWLESVEELRKSHNIYFIETREKEFCEMPENNKSYSVPVLSEDFKDALDELGLDISKCVFTGSSSGSNGILFSMNQYNLKPFLAVLATPMAVMERIKLLDTTLWMPYIVAQLLKPFFYLLITRMFRNDKAQVKTMKHGVSRMLKKKSMTWLRANPLNEPYIMTEEHTKNLHSPIVIVNPEADKTHDSSLMAKMVTFLPKAKFITVPVNSETHNKRFAKIILDEIENQRNEKDN